MRSRRFPAPWQVDRTLAHDLRLVCLVGAGSYLREAPMTSRRFPPPWRVEHIPGGFKVLDASGQALAYIYARETKAEADIAKVLTFDEARRKNPHRAFRVSRAERSFRFSDSSSGL
jgi:hypothetical protein